MFVSIQSNAMLFTFRLQGDLRDQMETLAVM